MSDDPKVIPNDQDDTTKREREQNIAVKEFGKDQKAGQKLMEVKVSSPFSTYFEDLAFSISAVNASGPFDILPGHHNFISLIIPCTMVVRDKEANEQKIQISGGIMHVKADRVIVFLDV